MEDRLRSLPGWLRELGAARRFGTTDRRGTLNLVDDAARSRAAHLVRTGRTISLARPLRGGESITTAERPGFAHETSYVEHGGGIGAGLDHVVLDPHGLMNTHLDALNHVAVDGNYYAGPVESPDQGSIEVLLPEGVVTRAVYVNACGDGQAWVERPVAGDDIAARLDAAGVELLPGDALCLDMGRDRYESAHGRMLPSPATEDDPGGGLSSDGARWIAEHDVAILAWDMLDSREAHVTRASAHLLTWAIGLLLVDNCEFAALRMALGATTQVAGALVLAPLVVPGANGVNLNPLVLC